MKRLNTDSSLSSTGPDMGAREDGSCDSDRSDSGPRTPGSRGRADVLANTSSNLPHASMAEFTTDVGEFRQWRDPHSFRKPSNCSSRALAVAKRRVQRCPHCRNFIPDPLGGRWFLHVRVRPITQIPQRMHTTLTGVGPKKTMPVVLHLPCTENLLFDSWL